MLLPMPSLAASAFVPMRSKQRSTRERELASLPSLSAERRQGRRSPRPSFGRVRGRLRHELAHLRRRGHRHLRGRQVGLGGGRRGSPAPAPRQLRSTSDTASQPEAPALPCIASTPSPISDVKQTDGTSGAESRSRGCRATDGASIREPWCASAATVPRLSDSRPSRRHHWKRRRRTSGSVLCSAQPPAGSRSFLVNHSRMMSARCIRWAGLPERDSS